MKVTNTLAYNDTGINYGHKTFHRTGHTGFLAILMIIFFLIEKGQRFFKVRNVIQFKNQLEHKWRHDIWHNNTLFNAYL
jgi:hypothetical protein